MTPARDLEPRSVAVQRCREVLANFLAAIDRGRATHAVCLFTAGACLDARGVKLQGRDQIARFLADREREERVTVHLTCNEVVLRATEDELELTALLLLYERRAEGRYELTHALETTQLFRRQSRDGWLIHARTVAPWHPDGDSPQQTMDDRPERSAPP